MGTFLTAPLRTTHESFDLTWLASDLGYGLVSFRLAVMDCFMTRSTDNQGFASPHRHTFDPSRFVFAPRFVEVCKLPDMVHCAVFLGTAQLTPLCEQALFDFTATAVPLFGSVVEDCRFLPSQFNAPKPGYQWRFVRATRNRHLQYFVRAMWRRHGRLVLPIDLGKLAFMFIGKRRGQRKFHHVVQPPQAVHVKCQKVVLHEAPIFRLVLTDNTVIGIVES